MDNPKNDNSPAKIDSHILIPKLHLKRFHKNGTYAIYDVKDKTISKHGSATNTNIQFGYYSKKFEGRLNEEIENPFSKVLAILEAWNYEEDSLTIDTAPIWNYVCSLLYRNPVVHNQVRDNSLCVLLPVIIPNDLIVGIGSEVISEIDLFHKYNTISVFINKTDIPFALPMMGIYHYQINGEDRINLPINPKMAICLTYEKDAATADGIRPITTDNPKVIMRLNEFAFETQVKAGQGFVLCSELSELRRLVSAI